MKSFYELQGGTYHEENGKAHALYRAAFLRETGHTPLRNGPPLRGNDGPADDENGRAGRYHGAAKSRKTI